MWFTTLHLAPWIWWVAEFQHDEQVMSYLFEWDEYNMLIDTGMGVDDIKKHIGTLSGKETVVLNTHHHFDHIGGNHQFDTIFSWDHEKMVYQQRGYTNQELKKYFTPEGFAGVKWFDFDSYIISPFHISQLLPDESIIDCHPFDFQVIRTPWHSKDSICVFERNNGYLFCGDTYYTGKIFVDNVTEYLYSLEKLADLPVHKVFPSHNSTNIDAIEIKDFIRFTLTNKKELMDQWLLKYQDITIIVKPDVL